MKNEKREKVLRASAGIFLLIAVTAVLTWLLGEPIVKGLAEPEKVRRWVESHGIWGDVVFVLCTMLQVIVALIPGEPLELAAGYIFGTIRGSLLCLGAASAASILIFWLVRRYGARVVHVFYPAEKLESVRFLKSSPKRTLWFALAFTLPGTPKDLLCYYAGLTDMKFSSFLLICSLGRIPSIISSTMGGNALGTEQYLEAIIVLAVALAVSGLGLLLYRGICRRNNRKSK